ncbi:putative F-box protein At4g22660 [Zingiber officinale]|uniref:putative F-box protein At4g22660 n=1 Tax=Zingiber officinale TaxID=94328 RepID=UPI001C4C3361|nr:putative F-box protein At4g22660 [Zingiber officinale]
MVGRGWSDLPLDLFFLVFSKLSLPQFLRSMAVCVSWSAAVCDLSTRGRCFKFRGQSPWLVLYHNPKVDPSAITFYALDERREYTIPVPDPPISDRIFLGSAHGWIITIDVRLRLQLLNPITGAQIDLPRLSRVFPSEHTHPIRDTAGCLIGFEMPIPVYDGQVRCGNNYIECLEQVHLKAILSADPSLGDGYTVALIQYPPGRIYFTRSGDEIWFDLNNPILIENMVFHQGKLYMSALSFPAVYVCDLAQIQHGEMPRFRVVDQCASSNVLLRYLFETPQGDLLSIWREKDTKTAKTISFKVRKVVIDDEEKPSKRLEKTMDMVEIINYLKGGRAVMDKQILQREEAKEDLGDLIIFLGGRKPLCLSACDFPHLTPNSIYFTDDNIFRDPEFEAYYRRMFEERNLQRFNVYFYHCCIPALFLERKWFRKILNCPNSFSIDKTWVRLYWQPPSNFIN